MKNDMKVCKFNPTQIGVKQEEVMSGFAVCSGGKYFPWKAAGGGT